MPFLNAHAAPLAHSCTDFAQRVDILDQALDAYSKHRSEWDAFARRHTTIKSDGIGTTEFTATEDMNEANVRAKVMDDLIGHMRTMAAELTTEGKKVSADLLAVYRQHFKGREGMITIVPNTESRTLVRGSVAP